MKKLTLLFVSVALLAGGAMAKEKSCCKKKGEHCTKESACCKDKKNCKHEGGSENKEVKQEAPKKNS